MMRSVGLDLDVTHSQLLYVLNSVIQINTCVHYRDWIENFIFKKFLIRHSTYNFNNFPNIIYPEFE